MIRGNETRTEAREGTVDLGVGTTWGASLEELGQAGDASCIILRAASPRPCIGGCALWVLRWRQWVWVCVKPGCQEEIASGRAGDHASCMNTSYSTRECQICNIKL